MILPDGFTQEFINNVGGTPDSNQSLREDLGNLYDLVNAMSKHVVILDDTVTRLTLEMKAMTELMITHDDFAYIKRKVKQLSNKENEDEIWNI